MTKDYIKATTTMQEVIARYGLQANRSGFIRCPFHTGDRQASLKIYPDSFYCYGCGAHGDIFAFVSQYEHCDFRTALKILGGDSGTRLSDSAVLRIARRREQQKADERKLVLKREEYLFYAERLRVAEQTIREADPLSNDWTREQHLLPQLRYTVDTLYTEVCGLIDKR